MAEKRLSSLDSQFLHLERQGSHMHVVSVLIFEGSTPRYREFRDHIEARLHKVPRYRQKLRFVPYGQGRPVWVDDPQLNLDYHVRHSALPAPGGIDELRTLAGRIHSQGLDLAKPLWELWLVDRLEGNRFAVLGKSHNALVDGVEGVDVTTVLFDTSPDAEPLAPPPPWVAEPEPTDSELLARALAERATRPAEAARSARALLRRPKRALSAVSEGASAAASALGLSGVAPDSPINGEIGPYRRAWWVDFDLTRLQAVKRYLGGTVNDALLGTVAGALRHYLTDHGHPTRGLELKALVPLSVKREGELGNSLSAALTPLPVWCEDPRQRVRIITDANADLRKRTGAVPADMLTELSDFSPPTISSQAARIQARRSLFNLAVTNVPGPQHPLYLMGARLSAAYPLQPLAPEQVVCVGAMSYDGRVHVSLVGDFDAIPDLDELGGSLELALSELEELIPRKEGRLASVRARRGRGRDSEQGDEAEADGASDGEEPDVEAGPEAATVP